jgi:hypothetical protein
MIWLASTASCRGSVWAEDVARRVRGGLQPWPAHAGKAAQIAEGKVADLAKDMRLRSALALIAYGAAAERWEELRADPETLVRVLGSRE